MADSATDVQDPVTVETPDGRIFSGVGVTAESLQSTVDARKKVAAPGDSSGTPPADRSDVGTTSPEPQADVASPPVDASAEADVSEPDIYHRDANTGQFKKISRGQKRFDQLTKEREDARREASAERDRRAALERQIDDLRRAQTSAASGTVAPSGVEPSRAVGNPTRPKPTVDQVGTKYQQYEDFVEDLSDWKAEQRLASAQADIDARIRQSIEADRASRALADKLSQRLDSARRQFPDFDAVIATSTVQFPQDFLHAIIDHPSSEFVQYQLAKDSALALRLSQLAQTNPYAAAFELAKLGPPPSVAVPASTGRAGVTSAPAPIVPVGSGSKTTVPPLQDLADHGDDYDTSGYRERRRAELKAVGRR